MAHSPVPDHITKAEASERYNFDFRNLGKQMAVAIAMGDVDYLQHFKLRTKDGAVRDGKDVETGEVLELTRAGLVPTWFISVDYLDSKYGSTTSDEPPDEFSASRKQHEKIIDAEIVETPDDDSGDDTQGIALLTNPVIQMQTQRIKELERDRERDAKTIETLTQTLSLLEELVRKGDNKGGDAPKATNGDNIPSSPKQSTTNKAEAPSSSPTTRKQSSSKPKPPSKKKATTRKHSHSKPKSPSKKKPRKSKKKWFNTHIPDLFKR